MSKKVSDEFVDYIANSGKTKLTADEVFREFVDGGFYERCKEGIPGHLQEAMKYWSDDTWKMYITNYCKLHFNVLAITDSKYKNIIS